MLPLDRLINVPMTIGELYALRQPPADTAALEALQRQYAALVMDHQKLQVMVWERDTTIAKLEAENAALKAAQPVPPVVVPDKPAPAADVFPFIGAYFEDPRKSDNVDDQAQAKEHADAMIPAMAFAAGSALRDYVVFCNEEDLKWNSLPRLMHDLKKRWWQSPIQIYFEDRPRFVRHLKALRDAGVYGCFIDDAQNITPDDMTIMLDLINTHIPGAPVAASFAALYDDSAYPKGRYIDSRQWFTRNQESEANWFPKWEAAQDAQIYTADVYRRSSGALHTPQRIEQSFHVALPFVQGIAWYSMMNKGWNHYTEHEAAKKKDPDTKTVWDVIRDCSAVFAAAYMTR